MTPSGALRRISVFGCALAALLVFGSNVEGRESDGGKKKPVVLVPPFENQSKHHENVSYEVATGSKADRPKRRFIIDRLTEAPRSVFENMLGNIEGITIVERQRVDALLVEAEFGGMSGLVDPEKAVKLGKMLGANVIIMGTIIDIHDEVVKFEGYGIKTENTKVISQIRVRLLDIETGNVRFSKIVKGSQTYSKSSFGGKSSSDRNFAAVESALQQLEGDSQFQSAVQGRKPGETDETADGLVEVEFAPKPENCDIEINGKYVGGSPLKRRLPAGKEFKVRIGKGGYKDWEGVIVPEKGLRITRELGPSR
jgi:hypothetical protein